MRVLMIAQYFFTPEQAGSARLYEFGRRLARAGHRPVLVTSLVDNFRKEIPEQWRGRWLVREEIDGLEVVRVRAYSRYRGSYARRVVNFASFMAAAAVAALRTGRCDLVFGTSPPPTVGLVAWLVSRLRRRPYIYEVRDLWPEAAVELGLLRSRVAIRALVGLERFLCGGAAGVIALTPGLKRRLVAGKGIAPGRIAVVTNGMNPDDFEGAADPEAARERLGLGGAFVVMQAGSIGASDDLHVMIRAAEILANEPAFRFVLVGDGDARAGLEDLVRSLGLRNVQFLPTRPRRELRDTLAAADALVCQIPAFYADCALPNRLMDYLGAGRPVITTGEGDAAALLREADAGLVVPPGDPAALAQAVRRLRDDGALRLRLGANARAFARERLAWSALFPGYLRLFEAAAGGGWVASDATGETGRAGAGSRSGEIEAGARRTGGLRRG